MIARRIIFVANEFSSYLLFYGITNQTLFIGTQQS